MNVPDHLRFADSHEWIDPTSGEACSVGISDHAQDELSDVVYVELPEIGRSVAKGDAVAVVESVKAASDIYAPVDGEIVAVNEALSDQPEAINTDAYGDGWIFKMKPSDTAGFSALHDAASYRKVIS